MCCTEKNCATVTTKGGNPNALTVVRALQYRRVHCSCSFCECWKAMGGGGLGDVKRALRRTVPLLRVFRGLVKANFSLYSQSLEYSTVAMQLFVTIWRYGAFFTEVQDPGQRWRLVKRFSICWSPIQQFDFYDILNMRAGDRLTRTPGPRAVVIFK